MRKFIFLKVTNLKTDEHVTLPDNLVVKIAGSHSITVPNDSTSLTVGSDVLFTKLTDSNWGGIKVKNNGKLKFSGNSTLEYGRIALRISDSDSLIFQQSSKVSIINSDPSTYGVMLIDDCSPMVRYVEITSEEESSDKGIYIRGSAAYPSLYNITIKDYGTGVYLEQTSDALMNYCVIDSLFTDISNGNCIILNEQSGESATIDLSFGENDIIPYGNSKAISNVNAVHYVTAEYNWWGSASPVDSLIFSEPDYILNPLCASTPFNHGASKISIPQENPFRIAAEFELAGYHEDALDIYYDIIQKETDTAFKRRAIKSIIKINHAQNIDYSRVRNVIQQERIQAASGYGQILDYLSCKLLINEKRFEEAISLLSQKADEYSGSHMEVEMLLRAAMVYGYSMNNKVKVIEYADRIAMINPGEPQLESIYRLAGLDYDPSQYYDKFSLELIDNNYNTESQPEEEYIVEDLKPVVSIAPNPANPKTTISYSLPEAAFVSLDIYSITGQKVSSLINGFTPAGNHNAVFDGSSLGSGIYLYRFQTKGFRKTGKMLMVK